RALKAEDVNRTGTAEVKRRWLLTQKSVQLNMWLDETKERMAINDHALNQFVVSMRPEMENEAEKKYAYIEQKGKYLKKRMIKKMESNHNLQLGHFRELENMLRQNGLLQERV